ncbi:hypothetical protein V6N11_033133 [Hibiscus sabdariffa]|uniref:Uncharacterized protein n=1 Tax=Hibiscus sabdariffa TaxID=183260 RepID=A0ABR1Z6K8_9ROSI
MRVIPFHEFHLVVVEKDYLMHLYTGRMLVIFGAGEWGGRSTVMASTAIDFSKFRKAFESQMLRNFFQASQQLNVFSSRISQMQMLMGSLRHLFGRFLLLCLFLIHLVRKFDS